MRHQWLVTALLLLVGCASRDEVSRVPSPDGVLDAVLLERGGGAARSFSYEIYVVKRTATLGRSPAVMNLDGAIRGKDAYGVNLKWVTPEVLAVEYSSAKAATLLHSTIQVEDRSVAIKPRTGVSDPAAPPGRMLHNARARTNDNHS